MSVTVYARNRNLPELRVVEDGTVHRVMQMYLKLEGGSMNEEKPYAAECGRLITGCKEVTDDVNCLECLAGAEVMIEAIKERLKL